MRLENGKKRQRYAKETKAKTKRRKEGIQSKTKETRKMRGKG